MSKMISSILFLISISYLISLLIISCGDDSKTGPVITHCLVNSTSTLLCMPAVYHEFSLSEVIKEGCQDGLTLGEKPTVFGKSYFNVIFPKPFNECINDISQLKTVSVTNETSVLMYVRGLSQEVNSSEFLNAKIEGYPSENIEVRPYTNFKEFIKEECWSGIEVGGKMTVDNTEWLRVVFPKDIEECYNLLSEEDIPDVTYNFGGSYMGIRIDNVAPTVSSAEELLNLEFSKDITISHLPD